MCFKALSAGAGSPKSASIGDSTKPIMYFFFQLLVNGEKGED